MTVVGLLGSTGFVGQAVERHCAERGWDVRPIASPRLTTAARTVSSLLREARQIRAAHLEDIAGLDLVINAAGMATATTDGGERMLGANALLPAVLALRTQDFGVPRLVHISSAVVQGRRQTLDDQPDYAPESEYGLSKVMGEESLLALDCGAVIHRATSVHGPGRSVTRTLARLAASPLAAVVRPGSDPTPQVHVKQVARAVGVLAAAEDAPAIALQPWEGFTTSSFLEMLGGRLPRQLPRSLAGALVEASFASSRLAPKINWGHARRIEMLLFGQAQRAGWLSLADPELTLRHPDWSRLEEWI